MSDWKEEVIGVFKQAADQKKMIRVTAYKDSKGLQHDYVLTPCVYLDLVKDSLQVLDDHRKEWVKNFGDEEVDTLEISLSGSVDRITDKDYKPKTKAYTDDLAPHLAPSTKDPEVLYVYDMAILTHVCADQEEKELKLKDALPISLYVPMLKLEKGKYGTIDTI